MKNRILSSRTPYFVEILQKKPGICLQRAWSESQHEPPRFLRELTSLPSWISSPFSSIMSRTEDTPLFRICTLYGSPGRTGDTPPPGNRGASSLLSHYLNGVPEALVRQPSKISGPWGRVPRISELIFQFSAIGCHHFFAGVTTCGCHHLGVTTWVPGPLFWENFRLKIFLSKIVVLRKSEGVSWLMT